MTNLEIKEYSERSIVVRGTEKDTKMHKEMLKTLGGKFNAMLKGGPGWIFSKKFEEKVRKYINGELEEEEKDDNNNDSNNDKNNDKNFKELLKQEIKKMTIKEKKVFLHEIIDLLL